MEEKLIHEFASFNSPKTGDLEDGHKSHNNKIIFFTIKNFDIKAVYIVKISYWKTKIWALFQ